MDDKRFYLQDVSGTDGNAMLWWRKGDKGCSTHLDEAEKYTIEEAESRKQDGRNTHVIWPCAMIDSVAVLMVDMQNCRKRWLISHPESSDLFEITDPVEYYEIMNNAGNLCEDVTGIIGLEVKYRISKKRSIKKENLNEC